MRFKKRLLDWTVIAGVKTLIVVSAIFPYRLGVAIGSLLGRLAYHLLKRHREKALKNLRFAFGPERDEGKIRGVAIDCFENLGRGVFELLCLRWRGLDNLQRSITIEGEWHLKEALDLGKGVIGITAHIGNWELLGILLAQKGYQVSVIAAPLHNKRLGEIADTYRSHFNIETITRGERSSARKIFRSLHENRILGLLLDQDIDGDGVYVDFFGKKAYTPSGVTSLALRFDIPVLITFIVREDKYRHRIIINKPEGLRKSKDMKSDILYNTTILTAIIESYVRAYPGQWVWMHDRWYRAR